MGPDLGGVLRSGAVLTRSELGLFLGELRDAVTAIRRDRDAAVAQERELSAADL